jgi:outer membrane receptor protein involved in Fe transport
VRSDPTFPGATDNGFPGVPDFALSAGARYERHLPWFSAASLAFAELDASYVGRWAADFTTSARHDPRTEANLTLGLNLGQTEAMIYVRNLLDEDGETFSFVNPFAPGPFSTRLRPRMAGVQLRYRF